MNPHSLNDLNRRDTNTQRLRARLSLTLTLLLATAIPLATAAFPRQATPVDPGELARRPDLIGHEIVVDDRLAYYVARTGTEDDEIKLKRTAVTFLVPSRLRPDNASRISAVVVRGTLERDGSRVVCRVSEVRPVPNDLERLKQGVASLPPQDFLTRQAWSRWADQRGRDFNDNALVQKAKALDAEALHIQGDSKRTAVDAPREWLTMARDARQRRVPEPEPSALAHRAFRALLQELNDPEQLRSAAAQIESFFPAVTADRQSGELNLGRYQEPYANDPAAAYRAAPESTRKAFDRRLWVDVTSRVLELQPALDIPSALVSSEKTAKLIPERPELPKRILEKSVAAARQGLGDLRLDQVKELNRLVREKLEQPQEASRIFADWLELRRNSLSRADAEGRILLAALFEELAQDRRSAIELLNQAAKIDPTSRDLAEAFRSRGFHKEKELWVESSAPGDSNRAESPSPRSFAGPSQGLRGLTPDEVRARIGRKPDRISKVGTRGQLIQQWIYLDTRQVRYVNLLHAPGEVKPKVIADYVLPRNGPKDDFDPPR